MEGISEEYFTQKTQEIQNLCAKYNKPEQDSKLLTEKYIDVLRTCQGIGSSNPLIREKSREAFPSHLETLMQFKEKVDPEIFEKTIQELFLLIDMMLHGTKWEVKAGGITAGTFILEKYDFKEFEGKLFEVCIETLFKNEYSLINQVLAFIAGYTKKHGSDTFEKIRERIYTALNKLWEKHYELIEEEIAFNKTEEAQTFNPLLRKEFFKACSETNMGFESYYKTLHTFIDEIPKNSDLLDQTLLDLVYKTKQHSKQEIRSLGCEDVGSLIPKLSDKLWNENSTLIVNFLADFMGDEFVTVRHQATLNMFKFVERAGQAGNLTHFTSIIVPRILLNRYHPAESLSKESMNLWKLFLERIGNPTGGREILGKLSSEACQYYVQQLKKSQPGGLKAACFALRELINRVEESKPAIDAHYDDILEIFLAMGKHGDPTIRTTCFEVLDSLAIKCPEKSRSRIQEFVNIGFFQICFNFKSEEIAESVALYLVEIYKGFKEDVHQLYLENIREKLLSIEKGEELIKVREEVQPIVFRGEVIRPKGFEVATGALILITELIPVNKEFIDSNLEILHTIVSLRKVNYYESTILYAWRLFDKAFSLWDKKIVKSEIEVIMDPLFRDITNYKPKVSEAASQVIRTVAGKIGENILKARVENSLDEKYLKEIDKILSSQK